MDYSSSGCYSIGPYDLAPGDSIKIVIADCIGGISPEVSREVSEKWWNNEDPGVPPGWEDNSKLPQQYQDFPELYAADARDEIVNLNKDKWVLSGRDSLFQTARAAKWAYDNNYNVPTTSASSIGNRFWLGRWYQSGMGQSKLILIQV